MRINKDLVEMSLKLQAFSKLILVSDSPEQYKRYAVLINQIASDIFLFPIEKHMNGEDWKLAK